MASRTTYTTVTFANPFSLSGFDRPQPGAATRSGPKKSCSKVFLSLLMGEPRPKSPFPFAIAEVDRKRCLRLTRKN
jgi:hypothetical protein